MKYNYVLSYSEVYIFCDGTVRTYEDRIQFPYKTESEANEHKNSLYRQNINEHRLFCEKEAKTMYCQKSDIKVKKLFDID